MGVFDIRVRYLMEHLADHDEITYFIPDEKKTGGRYSSVTGEINKVRKYEPEVEIKNGMVTYFFFNW